MDNPVAIFVGENGTGKSTPPEAAAVAYGLNTVFRIPGMGGSANGSRAEGLAKAGDLSHPASPIPAMRRRTVSSTAKGARAILAGLVIRSCTASASTASGTASRPQVAR